MGLEGDPRLWKGILALEGGSMGLEGDPGSERRLRSVFVASAESLSSLWAQNPRRLHGNKAWLQRDPAQGEPVMG